MHFFVVISIGLVLNFCKEQSTELENHPPTIQGVFASPSLITENEITTLSCIATDLDEDELKYSWFCNNGTFPEGVEGASTIWKAPNVNGTFKVNVIVSDRKETVTSSVSVVVQRDNSSPVMPSNPFPPNGISNVSIDIALSWECSDPDGDTLVYDVYFGTDSTFINAEPISSGLYDTIYELSNLENNKKYFWMIIAKDRYGGEAKSNVWSFITLNTVVASPEMLFIQGGQFEMGSNNGETDERPIHSLTLDNFYIGKYEVTHKEFIQFLNLADVNFDGTFNGIEYINLNYENCAIGYQNNSFYFKGSDILQTENTPAVVVTWYGVVAYCNWLSEQEGLNKFYTINDMDITMNWEADGYRLPTEAEWEYVACGGQSSQNYTFSGSNNIGEVAWYVGNYDNYIHEVGTKQPNEIGIYDLTGNVWEYCNDWYSSTYYSQSANQNPHGPISGYYRVIRGGSCFNGQNSCRNANRWAGTPDDNSAGIGFRLCKYP